MRIRSSQSLDKRVLGIGHLVVLAVVALAVLMVALVQSAKDDDIVGILGLFNGLLTELFS